MLNSRLFGPGEIHRRVSAAWRNAMAAAWRAGSIMPALPATVIGFPCRYYARQALIAAPATSHGAGTRKVIARAAGAHTPF